jgi:hypothetical protein
MNQHSVRKILPVAMVALGMLVMATPAAIAANTTVSFELDGPQITANPITGATIRTTGGGSFDPSAGTVVASGSFAEFNSNGSVAARGTWVATGFVSFRLFGGPNPGTQGGTLQITITLFVQRGASQTGVPMTVNCLVNAPSSFTGAEGDTIGDFTDSVRGHTLFHLNQ